MLGLLVVPVFAQEKLVTLHCRATAIPAVLADLSQQTGVPLKARDEARHEIVLIRVQKVGLGDLMKEIARVTSCSWTQSGNGYTLTPNNVLWRKEEDAELTARAAKITASIQARLSNFETLEHEEIQSFKGAVREPKKDDLQDSYVGTWNIDHPDYDSNQIACLRILKSLDARMLAALPQYEAITWASGNLTPFQRPLPGEFTSILAKYEADGARLSAERHREIQLYLANHGSTGDEDLIKVVQEQDQAIVRGPEPVDKAIFEASVREDGIYARLDLYDGQGDSIEGIGSELPKQTCKWVEGPDQKPVGGSEVTFDSDSAQIAEMFTKWRSTASPFRLLSPSLRSKFANVKEHDPLSFIASDLVEAYAGDRDRPLVASVPDGLVVDYLEKEGVIGISPASEEVAPTRQLSISTDGPFTLVSPARPAENRRMRLDREAIAPLFSRTDNNGMPRLKDLCDYAVSHPPISMTSIGAVWAKVLWPMMNFWDFEELWPVYSFLGSLSSGQWSAARQAQGLPFSKLTEEQRQLIAEESFKLDLTGDPEVVYKRPEHEESPSTMLGIELSEALPEALERGFVTLGYRSAPTIFSDSDQSDFFRRTLTPSAFGRLQWQSKNGQGVEGFTLPTQAKLGGSDYYTITFHLRPDLEVSKTLVDRLMPNASPLLNADQFPESFLKEVRATLDRMDKMRREDNQPTTPP